MTTPLPTAKLPELPDERLAAELPTSDHAGVSPPKPARDVPGTWSSSIGAWWTYKQEELAFAEERLLRRLPSFIPSSSIPDPLPTAANLDPLIARIMDFPLPAPGVAAAGAAATTASSSASSPAGTPSSSTSRLPFFGGRPKPQPRYLHGLAFWTPKTKAKTKEVNVLLHGYGAALGFFFNNLQAFGEISAESGRRAYALDWLGMGLSSRPSPKEFDLPPVPKPRSPLSPDEQASQAEQRVRERVTHAEDFFVQSLEEWRKSVGAETMCLVGHSLGGYLSAAYTLRYPDRVSKLILLSPAGIPINPHEPSVKSAFVPKKTSRLDASSPNEGEAQDIAGAAQKELGQTRTEAKAGDETPTPPRPSSRVRSLIGWAWEKGWSPFGVLRGMGPLAPRIVGTYASRRFEGLSDTDVKDMHALIYGISTARGSGEYCIHHLLAPGAFARWPMAERMGNLKQPVTFAYGSHDWMDIAGGRSVKETLRAHGNAACEVIEVPKAGHHLYLDNVDFTNRMLRTQLGSLPASA